MLCAKSMRFPPLIWSFPSIRGGSAITAPQVVGISPLRVNVLTNDQKVKRRIGPDELGVVPSLWT